MLSGLGDDICLIDLPRRLQITRGFAARDEAEAAKQKSGIRDRMSGAGGITAVDELPSER